MPPQPAGQLLSTSSEASFDWSLVVDVSVPVGQVGYEHSYPLPNSPLPGRWTVEIIREQTDLLFLVSHGIVKEARLGRHGVVELRLEWIDGGGSESISEETWHEEAIPDKNDDGVLYPGWVAIVTSARVEAASARFQEEYGKGGVMSFRLRFGISSEKASSTRTEQDLCSRMPFRTFRTPILPKVRLVFPRGEADPVDLWANSELLMQSSPYFETLFQSGFAESVQVGAKRPRRRHVTGKGRRARFGQGL
ncbi:hypothetical protein JCM8208_005554 [Rhodotorula glutinis]